MITRMSGLDVSSRQCVVFDYDGTLADTKPGIVSTATSVLLDWGLDADLVARKVDQLVGPPFPQAFSQVFGVSAEDAAEITRRYRQIYSSCGADAWPLFDGVFQMLGHLRGAGRNVVVASSKLQWLIDRGVADNNMGGVLDAAVGSSETVATKKAAILAAIDATGCAPSQAIMVGDRFHDVDGAAACGIPCVGVLWGNTGTREELERAGAVAVVDTVDELEQVLLGL